MSGGLRPPILCLVTDRRVLRARDEAGRLTALVELVGAAGRAGVDLVQLRERDLPARSLAALAEQCLAALATTGTRLVVNERLDVALAVGAHGVHLRSESPPAVRVRELAPPPFLVGRSVHGVAEAQAAAAVGGLDYLLLGTIFPSTSKPGAAPLGVTELARAARAVSVPVLAIGGVDLATLPQVAASGAAGLAAIRLFLAAGDEPAVAAERLTDLVGAARAAFAASQPRS